MKSDDPLRAEKLITTHPEEKAGVPTSPPRRARSSGRGLYITAIVLGIIIAVLLVLYIFLSFTVKRPAHGIVVPVNIIASQITSFILPRMS